MENKIKEVQQYFKEKLLNGEFEPVDVNGNEFKIIIDGSYKFNIWVASYYAEHTQLWYGSFIQVEFTPEEIVKLHELVSPIYVELVEKTARHKRKEKFERLRDEYEKSRKEFE